MRSKLSKFLSLILIAAMIVTGTAGFSGITNASAADKSVKIYATVSDGEGNLVVKQQTVKATDVDGDGIITVLEALYCTHEKYFKGGASAGFATAVSDWGLSVVKFWGVETSSVGYYVNGNTMTMPSDPVKSGDYVDAFIYQDQTAWSDKYATFSKRIYEVKAGKKVTLSLSASGFDADWAPIEVPVAGATILKDGEATKKTTNSKGTATLKITEPGSYLISASSKDMTLVPPTCIISVLPAKGYVITIDHVDYTVTKAGSLLKNKKGKVTVNRSDLFASAPAPKTITFGGITYKVTIIED